MKTRPAIWLVTLLLAWPEAAQQHPNQKKGFNANDVYQFNGIDSINTFNGNLVLTVPLGASYAVGGGLTYRLTLISNANIWEGEEICRDVNNDNSCDLVCNRRLKTSCDNQDLVMPNRMYPHRRANAGFGWTMSLGRLYQPDHPAMSQHTVWTYESPDGADHPFPDGDVDAVSFTDDATYLRMRVIASGAHAGRRAIDFPNGETHYFGPPETADGHWVLREITNQFPANYLRISYVTTAQGLEWRLEDSHQRTHTIYFEPMAYDDHDADADPNDDWRLLVRKIALSRFGTSTPAEITFAYTAATLNRGVSDTDPQSSNDAPVQRLDGVTFPDGTGYTFSYRDGSLLDNNGVLHEMTLPTGGKVEWSWGLYEKPVLDPHVNVEYLQSSYGVVERRTYGRPVNGVHPLIGKTTYERSMEATCNPYDQRSPPCREFKNSITDPSGTKSVHYFSVAPYNDGQWLELEYGQPFTKYTSDGTAGDKKRWLSSQVFASGGTQPLRSTYARYEHDGGKDWRPASTRTVYENDVVNGAAVYMDSDSSDWDGHGHYRTVRTSGTVPDTPARVTTTNYLSPGPSWIAGLYDSQAVEENGKRIEARFCFDSATGFLRRKRSFRDVVSGAAGANDLIAVYEPDLRGEVLSESYYGGDVHPSSRTTSVAVGTGSLCTMALPASVYRIDHTRIQPGLFNGTPVEGTLRSVYTGFPDLHVTDVSVDQRTGLVSSTRDTAGVQTSYAYDWAGRLTETNPAGRARAKYDYISPGNYEIVEGLYPAGAGSIPAGATPLTYSKHLVDGLGRVTRTTTAMPGNTESSTYTFYDGAGRRTSVSEPGFPSALTSYLYDPFGRVKKVTLPDTSVTDYAYTGDGVRRQTRTSRIWTGGAQDSVVTTVEQYDGFGRLVAVTENSGPTTAANPLGAAVTTAYEYDPADRLAVVTMNRCPATGPCTQSVQRRLFDYDGRGFLRWESQPESGLTSYLYDARGHLVSRSQGGSGTQFDLEHYYDGAERLTRIEARNPFHGEPLEPQFRVMKEFTFGTANVTGDLVKGKLRSAARFNYGGWSGDPVYKVAEQYVYGDAAGRRTARTTTIRRASGYDPVDLKVVTMGVTYDDLDQRTAMTYPMCEDCGAPPVDPERSLLAWSYDRGRFKSLTGFVNDVSYWPNGVRHVQPHSNGIADTQSVTSMARPSQIKFGLHERCEVPRFTQQPAGAEVPATGNVELKVVMAGTGPFKYAWWNATTSSSAGTTAAIYVRPSVTTRYYVLVDGPCGYVQSQDAVVTVGECVLPSTGEIKALSQPDGSWILTPSPSSRSPRTFAWRRLPDPTVVGTAETYTVTTLTQTTTFSLTIADACGSSTSNVTVKVPLPITTTALTATANSTFNAISVTWPAVTGATSYTVARRSGGMWEEIGWPASPSWTDTQVVPGRTYAYRVHALGSGGTSSSWSNSDVATTRAFTPALAGQPVSATASADMLAAVNSVRAAAGWPGLTWNNILALNDPLPVPGQLVSARHIASCRARMNEALHALGAPVAEYTDPDVGPGTVRALHIVQVQERAQ